MRIKFSAALTIFALFFLAGCTLGPNPERPQTAADTAEAFVNAVGADSSPDGDLRQVVSPWWTTFGDEATSQLVDLALANNTDLQIAAARILETEANLSKSRSSMWPQLEYQANAGRTKNSFVLPEVGRRTVYSTTYSDAINASYQVDLFGKLKRTRQGSWSNLLAERAAQETIQHSVIASVVRSRVQIATAERALDVAQNIRSSWESTLETVERRYRSGLVGAVDLHLARENLAATRDSEIQLEASLKQARHGLDVIVGRRPGGGPALPDTLPELPGLEPVPVGLPAALLDRRPDLKQAEMQFAAATYGVGAAMADLYPSLSLTASGGTTSDSLGDLTDGSSIVYNAIANIVGPIFTGGARRAEVRASKARAEAAGAAYAGAVLNALREVENALVADEANIRRLESNRRRLHEAQAADSIARERYQRGVESFLRVLETERRLRAAEQAMITTKADLWNTRIDLFLSVGGDWSVLSPPSAPESTVEGSPQNEVSS